MRYSIAFSRGLAGIVAASALGAVSIMGTANAEPDATTTVQVAPATEVPPTTVIPEAPPAPVQQTVAPVPVIPEAPPAQAAPTPVVAPPPPVVPPAPTVAPPVVQPTVEKPAVVPSTAFAPAAPSESRTAAPPPSATVPPSSSVALAPAPDPSAATTTAVTASPTQRPAPVSEASSSSAPSSESSSALSTTAAVPTSSYQPTPTNNIPETTSAQSGSSIASSTTSSEEPAAQETSSSEQFSSTQSSRSSSASSTALAPVARLVDPIPVSDASVEKAKKSVPVDVMPSPATNDQLKTVNSAVLAAQNARDNDHHGNDGVPTSQHNGNGSNNGHNDDHWDGHVRPWQWIRYDDFHRPVIYNPLPNPCDFVYYDGPYRRVVRVNPGLSVTVNVVNNGVYSFTSVQIGANGIAVNVAVGSFNGGGYVPQPGYPVPPPWQPTYVQNVTVYYAQINVRRSIRVQRITDCGPDPTHGNMSRVLYNDTSVGWGTWHQDDHGQRYFDASTSQELPGVSQEGPGVPASIVLASQEDQGPPAASDNTMVTVGITLLAVGSVVALAWLVRHFLLRRRVS